MFLRNISLHKNNFKNSIFQINFKINQEKTNQIENIGSLAKTYIFHHSAIMTPITKIYLKNINTLYPNPTLI